MDMVSTASILLSAMKFDDAVYSSMQRVEPDEEQKKKSLWNIPGLGIIGLGVAAGAFVLAYKAMMPSIGEDVDTATDVFKSLDEIPEDDKIEQVGQLGEKTGEEGLAEKKPRVAEVKPVTLPSPKADVDEQPATAQEQVGVPQTAVVPIVAKPSMFEPRSEPTVSKGTDIPQVAKITSGMALGTNVRLAKPAASIEAVLRSTAKEENVDYAELYAVAGSESSFNAGASASVGTATGLFQFTAPTWNYLTTKVYPELRYGPGDRTDPKKSAVLASRYLKAIKKTLAAKIGHAPSIGQTYLGYFMGPTGAARFIEEHKKNPSAKGADVFKKAAAANPQLFYNKGNRAEPLTLSETMDRLEGKVTRYYAQATQTSVTVARQETAPVVEEKQTTAKAVSVASLGVQVAQAKPKVQTVEAPDFTAAGTGAKEEQRDTSAPDGKIKVKRPQEATTMTSGSAKDTQEVTYFRDKQGRLVSLRG